MIPVKAQLPSLLQEGLTDFEKDLLKKLTALLEQQAREINRKVGSELEDSMFWMTRP